MVSSSVRALLCVALLYGVSLQSNALAQGHGPNSPRVNSGLRAFLSRIEDASFRDAILAEQPERAALILANAAGIYYDANNFPLAMRAYRAFGEFIEPFNNTIDPNEPSDELIRSSLAVKDAVRNYVRFMFNTHFVRAPLCNENDCLTLAWSMLEQHKSRLLRRQLLLASLARRAEAERDRIRALIQEYRRRQLARMIGNAPFTTAHNDPPTALGSAFPEYAALISAVAKPVHVASALEPNETFLSFFYTNNQRAVYAWKVEKGSAVVPVKLEITTEELFVAIEQLKALAIAGRGWEGLNPLLDRLYAGVIVPLHLKPSRRLIIATDQNLLGLPFDILPFQGVRMMDLFDLTYVPSATVFLYLRHGTKPRQYQREYVGFGFRGAGTTALNHANTEIANAGMCCDEPLEVFDATEAGVYAHASDIASARYLHFATHSLYAGDRDGSIYLVLGSGDRQDGRLTPLEIVEKLPNKAEVVVLSSCETAPLHDQYAGGQQIPLDPGSPSRAQWFLPTGCLCSYGDSFSTIAGAFFASGSQRLLATQWPVDDRYTDELITDVFAGLATGRPLQDALKTAKRAMREKPPGLWAGFVSIGD